MYNTRMGIILRAFGLTEKSKLPVDGAPARTVYVWWKEGAETVYRQLEMWINPVSLGPYRRNYKSSKHRVMARCHCGKVFSAGRIHQHVCKH